MAFKMKGFSPFRKENPVEWIKDKAEDFADKIRNIDLNVNLRGSGVGRGGGKGKSGAAKPTSTEFTKTSKTNLDMPDINLSPSIQSSRDASKIKGGSTVHRSDKAGPHLRSKILEYSSTNPDEGMHGDKTPQSGEFVRKWYNAPSKNPGDKPYSLTHQKKKAGKKKYEWTGRRSPTMTNFYQSQDEVIKTNTPSSRTKGKIKTVDYDVTVGSHTTIVLESNVGATLADDDEICFKTPIELMLGLEY